MLYFLHPALISQQGVTGSRGKRGVGTSWLMVFTPPCCSELHKASSPPVKHFASQRERLSVWWVWMFTWHRAASGTNRCAVQNTAHTGFASWFPYSGETHRSVMEKHRVTLRCQCQETITWSKSIYCTWLWGYGYKKKKNVIWGWQMRS